MKKLLSLILSAMLMISIVGCSTSSTSSSDDANENQESFKLQHGEKLEETITGDILVIKAKIEPSLNNKTTISQNGLNVEDLIENQGADKFKEIQYWAVADMSDGSEKKVVSFTVNEEMINNIKDGNIPGNTIVDNAEDVYILPSLLQ